MPATGSSDESAKRILKSAMDHPVTTFGIIAMIVGLSGWGYSLNAGLNNINEKVSQYEGRMNGLEKKIQDVDDRSTRNLERLRSTTTSMANDVAEMKGTVRGIDNNVQTLIRQSLPPPPR